MILIDIFVVLFGLIFGSFLNVLIIRLPLQQSIITPRSNCPSCNATISWYDNIPLLSFILLKAKCRHCSMAISSQYPIVEFLTAGITLLLFWKLSFSLEFIQMCVMFYLFIVLSFIDLKYKAVPDYLLLFILLLSLSLVPLNIQHLLDAMLFAGGFVLLNFIVTFYIQNIKSKAVHDDALRSQEALGEGDLPIVASIGAVLGALCGLVAIFLAALFAIVPSVYNSRVKKDIQTPFIPFLSLGFGCEYLFNISHWLIP
ncbi:MAG: prepilin peptidase [Campylobacterota bacterium]|nr:prepilin peptidase [Campylobacterota bacterium]